MSPEEQAAVAQMMMGVRTALLGAVQQIDGLLRLLTKDAVASPEQAKRHKYLGEDDG